MANISLSWYFWHIYFAWSNLGSNIPACMELYVQWEILLCFPTISFANFLVELKMEVTQSCPTLCDPMDFTGHGILQARILEWVAFSFSRESSQPRDRTQVSCIAGRFFTSWATRESQEYWNGEPIPSPADLPNPGIELVSSALQADSLPAELPGKPRDKP